MSIRPSSYRSQAFSPPSSETRHSSQPPQRKVSPSIFHIHRPSSTFVITPFNKTSPTEDVSLMKMQCLSNPAAAQYQRCERVIRRHWKVLLRLIHIVPHKTILYGRSYTGLHSNAQASTFAKFTSCSTTYKGRREHNCYRKRGMRK